MTAGTQSIRLLTLMFIGSTDNCQLATFCDLGPGIRRDERRVGTCHGWYKSHGGDGALQDAGANVLQLA